MAQFRANGEMRRYRITWMYQKVQNPVLHMILARTDHSQDEGLLCPLPLKVPSFDFLVHVADWLTG